MSGYDDKIAADIQRRQVDEALAQIARAEAALVTLEEQAHRRAVSQALYFVVGVLAGVGVGWSLFH